MQQQTNQQGSMTGIGFQQTPVVKYSCQVAKLTKSVRSVEIDHPEPEEMAPKADESTHQVQIHSRMIGKFPTYQGE
ncbi:hypothetical protein [Ktedonobacter robiniae]|uniref:hypothetical protein n=1 Tax=Ktedonobacter robiniae TaxID=2778365 RepID=UPI001916A983|nr:hypothetical protein [Ktedonobacter robiniae]